MSSRSFDKSNSKLPALLIVAALAVILCVVLLAVVMFNQNKEPDPSVSPADFTSEPGNTPAPSDSPSENPTAAPDETPGSDPTSDPTQVPTNTPSPTPAADIPESKIGPVPSSISSDIITHGNTSSKKIALSVNVAWGEECIPDILRILDEYNIKTSFMIQGYWAKYLADTGCPEYLQNIYKAGHELGIHGWGHDDSTTLSEETLRRVLKKAHDEIQTQTGYDTWLYAPASGYVNESVALIAADIGYRTVTWTVDSIDWNTEDPDIVFDRISGSLTGGTIILFHPTQTLVKVLPRLIEEAQRRGYNITTISDCIS